MESKNKESRLFSGNLMLLAKKMLIENRKLILLLTLGIVGMDLLFGGFMGFWGKGGGMGESGFFWGLSAIYMFVAASVMFAGMKRKEGRISVLMLPATTFEKWLVRWVAALPLMFVVCVAGMYIGDLTRILVHFLVNGPFVGGEYSRVFNPWTLDMLEGTFSMWLFLLVAISNLVLTHSVFFFGGILWPKLSFIKTLGVIWGLQFILGNVLVIIARNLPMSLWLKIDELNGDVVAACWAGVSLVIAGVLYWLSYRRLRSSQVVYKLI